MTEISRRTILKGAGATALAAMVPVSVQTAEAAPLVPALPRLSIGQLGAIWRAIDRWGRYADAADIWLEKRLLYQHLVGGRFIQLNWHSTKAISRIQTVGDRWPLLQPNIDRAKAARLAGLPDFTHDDWNYQNVRIDHAR